jgi:hypothetical protein
MATSPSVFPFAHIALTAAITAGLAFLMLVALRARFKTLPLVVGLLVAVVVGISVIVWRSAGNTGALNTDPIPKVASQRRAVPVGDVSVHRLLHRLSASYRCRALRAGTGAARPGVLYRQCGDDLMRRKSILMASKLILRQYIDLPFHPEGDFDHGDVVLSNGSVFIANTAADTVEVVDGEGLRHLATIPGCPEASGVLAADVQDNTARLVDPHAGRVVATAALPGRPRWAVYQPTGERFLVNIRELRLPPELPCRSV